MIYDFFDVTKAKLGRRDCTTNCIICCVSTFEMLGGIR